MNHAEIIARVHEARPDILLVAFGCPKQEKWIFQHYRALGVPVAIGVGGTVDFLARRIRRAPAGCGKAGLNGSSALAGTRRLFPRYARNLLYFSPPCSPSV